MNELLEAKLTLSRIKAEVLTLAVELVENQSADKAFAIKRLLEVVEFIEGNEVEIKDINL